MKRFKNILVPLDWRDDNHLLIQRGLLLSQRNESALNFVLSFSQPPFSEQGEPSFNENLNVIYQKGIKKNVEEIKEKIDAENAEGIALNVFAVQGDPAEKIIEEVVREGVDLVMMGVWERLGGTGPLLSGLPLRLIRRCPSAVWAMKPTPIEGFNRIVVGVDIRDPSDEARSLNQKVLEVAASLAKSEKSELHVLHASSISGEAVLRGSVDDNVLDEWLDRKKEKSRHELKEFLKPFDKEITKVHVHEGPAEVVLPVFIKHFKADLLVMGTVSRAGLSGFLVGNTAEKILHKVACSVLTIKPDNFKVSQA